MNTTRDPEQAAAEAHDDHLSTVGEACIRENRAPTEDEERRFYELEAAYDATIAPLNAAEQALIAKAYKRTLEGRGF